MQVSRYVVLNPVRAKIVESPDEWEWSSYRCTVDREKPHAVLTIDWIQFFYTLLISLLVWEK